MICVALVPSAGWLLAAAATLIAMTFGTEPRVGAALVVFIAVALPPLLIRGASLTWSVPALAPLLGLVGLAGAFPALAGTARSAWCAAPSAPAGRPGCCWPSRCSATTCCSAIPACRARALGRRAEHRRR